MKRLRVGVFGAGRGCDLAQNFLLLDCDIVALCDSREDRIREGLRLIPEPEAIYHDFDSFIAHDMDGTVLVATALEFGSLGELRYRLSVAVIFTV